MHAVYIDACMQYTYAVVMAVSLSRHPRLPRVRCGDGVLGGDSYRDTGVSTSTIGLAQQHAPPVLIAVGVAEHLKNKNERREREDKGGEVGDSDDELLEQLVPVQRGAAAPQRRHEGEGAQERERQPAAAHALHEAGRRHAAHVDGGAP